MAQAELRVSPDFLPVMSRPHMKSFFLEVDVDDDVDLAHRIELHLQVFLLLSRLQALPGNQVSFTFIINLSCRPLRSFIALT